MKNTQNNLYLFVMIRNKAYCKACSMRYLQIFQKYKGLYHEIG
jgi:hypothetical protein